MIKCPNCGSKKWNNLYTSLVDPANDKFKCQQCLKEFTRYQSKNEKGVNS